MDLRLRPSFVPAKRSPAQSVSVNGQGNGATDGLNPSQTAAPIDRKGRSTTASPNP